MHLLVLLDQPHHLLGGVAELFGGTAEVQQPAEPGRLDLLGRAAQDPQLESFPHLVESVFEVAHLGGEALVVEEQRRVGEADRDLRHVLHLDQHVDRAVEVGDHRGIVVGSRGAPLGRAGELAQLGDAFGGAAQDQHVVGQQHLVAVGVEEPVVAAPDRDDPHPDLDREAARRRVSVARARCRAGPARGARSPPPPRDRRRAREVSRAGGSRCARCRRRRCPCARSPRARAARSTSPRRRVATGRRARRPHASRARDPPTALRGPRPRWPSARRRRTRRHTPGRP